MIIKGPDGLEQFADRCAEALFASDPIEIVYPEGSSHENWPVDKICKLNKSVLKGLRGNGNLYAIHARRSEEEATWNPVYVGERESEALRERITQHLIKKSDGTGSKLAKVKKAVSEGHKIAISYIKIEPEALRLYVEETIISNNGNLLRWNTHGVKKHKGHAE